MKRFIKPKWLSIPIAAILIVALLLVVLPPRVSVTSSNGLVSIALAQEVTDTPVIPPEPSTSITDLGDGTYLYKNKWLHSYETLLFDTPDGDIGIGEYALDEEGTGYYIRTRPKDEAQFNWVDLKYDTKGLVEVHIVSGHSYYDEFLTAEGATNLWDSKSALYMVDFSELPSGSILRAQSSTKKYWDTANIKDYPQPERIEIVTEIPPIEPLPEAPSHHSIALDATSNSGYLGSISSYSWSHTCTGDNRLLAFGCAYYYTTITAVTYNSVALSFARGDAYSYVKSAVYYLIAPDTGENTIAVTFAGNSAYNTSGVVSYTGAKQSGQCDAVNGANASGGAPTVSVTTVADNCWVFAVENNGYGAITCANTERWNVLGNMAGRGGSDTGGPKTPAGDQTMSWTGGGGYWAMSAASFAPYVVEADISNDPATWNIGHVQAGNVKYFSANGEQDDDYALITNTGGVAVDVQIQGLDIEGGSYDWTLGSSAGDQTYSLYANSEASPTVYDIEVKKADYSYLCEDLAVEGTYNWSMKFTAPTALNPADDGLQKSTTITLVAIAAD